MNVLLLNATGAPLGIVSARKAFSLLTRGAAYMVLPDPEPLRTAGGLELERPSILALTRFQRGSTFIRWTKREVLARDGHRCAYCGERATSVDHIRPQHLCRAEGRNPDTWENTVAACTACNHRKGGRTPAEAGMRFRPGFGQPAAPRHVRPALLHRVRTRPEWNLFLQEA